MKWLVRAESCAGGVCLWTCSALRDLIPALIIALFFWCMIDYRLHCIAWLIPAMLLIGGRND